MKTGSLGLKLIETYEGLILKAYDDFNDHVVSPGQSVRGTLTIGYGHTNAAGSPKVYAGQSITKEEADKILASDLASVEKDVNRLVHVPINQNQFDALVSFHFNTGALGRSSILKALNAKDYNDAANRLMLYNRGNGQVLAGLTRRRQSEKDLFLRPVVSKAPANSTASGTIIAGGAVLTQTPHHYWPYIIAGTVIVAALGWFLVHRYNKRNELPPIPALPISEDKGTTNVQ